MLTVERRAVASARRVPKAGRLPPPRPPPGREPRCRGSRGDDTLPAPPRTAAPALARRLDVERGRRLSARPTVTTRRSPGPPSANQAAIGHGFKTGGWVARHAPHLVAEPVLQPAVGRTRRPATASRRRCSLQGRRECRAVVVMVPLLVLNGSAEAVACDASGSCSGAGCCCIARAAAGQRWCGACCASTSAAASAASPSSTTRGSSSAR